MKVKKSTCPSCGAPKMTPNKTCYIYCDYCATLIDFDFQKLSESLKNNSPAPEYFQKIGEISGKLNEAKEKKDREKYTKLQREFYELLIENQPVNFSPRVKNKEYREAFLNFQAESGAEIAFNEELSAMEAERNKVMGEFAVNPTEKSIREVFDVYYDCQTKIGEHLYNTGMLEGHPDGSQSYLYAKISASTFVQGWMHYFSDESDLNYALQKSGLINEYIEVEDSSIKKRVCANCGADIIKTADGKITVCEECGEKVDVQHDEFACPGCAMPLSLPVGTREMNCPSCGTLFKNTD